MTAKKRKKRLFKKTSPLRLLSLFSITKKQKVVEVRARYDDACSPGSNPREKEAALLAASAPPPGQSSAGGADGGLRCTVSLPPLPRAISKGPVYLTYELTAFHQNHRRYVRSRSEAQLRGGGDGFPWEDGKKKKKSFSSSSAITTPTCAPRETATTTTEAGEASSSVIVPCGLVAWSNFNDTFSLEAVVVSDAAAAGGDNNATTTTTTTTVPLSLDAAPLRSRADLLGRFSPRVFPSASFESGDDPAARGGGALPLDQSLADAAALQVWMRPAALPSFRKPAGVVVGGVDGVERTQPLSSLPAGAVVRVTVANRFNSYRYGGTKSVALTTRSWLGGRNPFLGWAGVGVGGGCVAAAAALALVAVVEAKKEGNKRS